MEKVILEELHWYTKHALANTQHAVVASIICAHLILIMISSRIVVDIPQLFSRDPMLLRAISLLLLCQLPLLYSAAVLKASLQRIDDFIISELQKIIRKRPER